MTPKKPKQFVSSCAGAVGSGEFSPPLPCEIKAYNKGLDKMDAYYKPILEELVLLLEAWTRSEWKDFIKDNPSPLRHNTLKFLENYESEAKNG